MEKRVIAVSRFSDPLVVELLRENGVEMISADLLAPGALDSLPDAENVIYMAGKKFGTDGNEYATWAMNTWLPSRVAERYQNSRIVVFSSGNLYPKVGVHSGGATEETRTEPVGEYCMSCQGRERMFEYAAGKMFRLFGYPTVPLETLIEWQAQWILDGGRALGKPTHFEERKGSY